MMDDDEEDGGGGEEDEDADEDEDEDEDEGGGAGRPRHKAKAKAKAKKQRASSAGGGVLTTTSEHVDDGDGHGTSRAGGTEVQAQVAGLADDRGALMRRVQVVLMQNMQMARVSNKPPTHSAAIIMPNLPHDCLPVLQMARACHAACVLVRGACEKVRRYHPFATPNNLELSLL